MKIYLFIASLLFITACANPKNTAVIKIPPFKPEVIIYQCGDSLNIALSISELNNKKDGKRNFLESIKNSEINFYFGKRPVKHLALKDFLIKKTINDSNELMLYGGFARFNWPNPKTRTHDMTVEIKIFTKKSIYAIKTNYTKILSDYIVQCNGALDLLPFEIKSSDTSYVLGMAAVRRDMNEDEYVPSSEDFRAEIFTYKGTLLWSSNFNMNYMQLISEVKPIKIGEAYLFTTIWNGRKNNKKKVRSGDYKIKLLLPVQPHPYYIMKDFTPEFK